MKTDELYLIIDNDDDSIFDEYLYTNRADADNHCRQINNYSPQYSVCTIKQYLQHIINL